MPLGTELDLGPGHIVLDGAQLLPPGKGHSNSAPFGSCIVAKRSLMSFTAEFVFNYK